MKNKKIIIGVIIFIAVFFRIYSLQSVPPHPSLDEVSIGYNAYSILRIGLDEFGNANPILLRAYDDYRPAHYMYTVVPFIKTLGLSIISVRLPSVLLSIAVVVSVYFLIGSLFRKYKYAQLLAILTISLLAISPWHIYISRLGHEVNLFYSAFIFGLTFFYKYIEKSRRYMLVFSSISFGISFSAYQSGKIFIPLMLIALFIIYYKELLKNKLFTLFNILIFLTISFPILITSLQPQALVRFKATNIYSMAEPYLKDSALKVMEAKAGNEIFAQVINNRRWIYIFLPANAYISHLNPFWLFTNEGDESFKMPNLGLLFIFELPLILTGGGYLFFSNKIEKRTKAVVLLWLILSIVPGAITTGFPHAMRTLQVLPLPHVLTAFGFIYLYSRLKYQKLVILLFFLLFVYGLVILFKSYFVDFPKKTAHQFQYGIDKAISFASTQEEKYDQILVSNKKTLFQSYMFFLYFSKFDPSNYQKLGGTKSGGFAEEHRIGKYFFGNIENLDVSDALIISNPYEISSGNKLRTIYYPDGKESLWILEP